jgi:hypothetical protein
MAKNAIETDSTDSEPVAINPDNRVEEAYDMGYEKCERAGMKDTVDHADELYMVDCPRSSILPTLRAIGGNSLDRPANTGTQSIKLPDGDVINSGWLVDKVMSAYRRGTEDCLLGREKEAPKANHLP